MPELDYDSHPSILPKLLKEQIASYPDLVLLYQLYATRRDWDRPVTIENSQYAQAARELITSSPVTPRIEKLPVQSRDYDFSQRAQVCMQYSIEHVLPLVFSEDRVMLGLHYTGPDVIRITLSREAHYKSQKKTHYRDMTPDQRKPLEIGEPLIVSMAERIKTAVPSGFRDRVSDADFLDTAMVANTAHEFMHAVEETIAVDAQNGDAKESAYIKSKRLHPERFLVTQDTIWSEVLHREQFARGVEMKAMEQYMKDVLHMTDEEYLQFHKEYYGKHFAKAAAFRNLLTYLMKTDPEYSFEKTQMIDTSIQSRLRLPYIPLPNIAFFLPYMEEPYSLDMIRELSRDM